MKIRDKLYKQFIKSKINQTCKIKQAAFKKYRNKITDLLRISKVDSLIMRNILAIIRKMQMLYGKESMKLFIQKKMVKTTHYRY